eukprot:COSAG06_NODE_37129_length_439_cov_0.458824_2_plen_66_part_01
MGQLQCMFCFVSVMRSACNRVAASLVVATAVSVSSVIAAPPLLCDDAARISSHSRFGSAALGSREL